MKTNYGAPSKYMKQFPPMVGSLLTDKTLAIQLFQVGYSDAVYPHTADAHGHTDGVILYCFESLPDLVLHHADLVLRPA